VLDAGNAFGHGIRMSARCAAPAEPAAACEARSAPATDRPAEASCRSAAANVAERACTITVTWPAAPAMIVLTCDPRLGPGAWTLGRGGAGAASMSAVGAAAADGGASWIPAADDAPASGAVSADCGALAPSIPTVTPVGRPPCRERGCEPVPVPRSPSRPVADVTTSSAGRGRVGLPDAPTCRPDRDVVPGLRPRVEPSLRANPFPAEAVSAPDGRRVEARCASVAFALDEPEPDRGFELGSGFGAPPRGLEVPLCGFEADSGFEAGSGLEAGSGFGPDRAFGPGPDFPGAPVPPVAGFDAEGSPVDVDDVVAPPFVVGAVLADGAGPLELVPVAADVDSDTVGLAAGGVDCPATVESAAVFDTAGAAPASHAVLLPGPEPQPPSATARPGAAPPSTTASARTPPNLRPTRRAGTRAVVSPDLRTGRSPRPTQAPSNP
jgi:hypothetical protein